MQGMDADMMAMMPPEAMQGMDADMMAAMPPEAMQGMDADMMAAMPPGKRHPRTRRYGTTGRRWRDG